MRVGFPGGDGGGSAGRRNGRRGTNDDQRGRYPEVGSGRWVVTGLLSRTPAWKSGRRTLESAKGSGSTAGNERSSGERRSVKRRGGGGCRSAAASLRRKRRIIFRIGLCTGKARVFIHGE